MRMLGKRFLSLLLTLGMLLMLLPGSGKRVPLACLAASFAAAMHSSSVASSRP